MAFKDKVIVGGIITLMVLGGLQFVRSLGKADARNAEYKLSDNVVKAMDDCVATGLHVISSDSDINRLYKQCWNHSKLTNRK